MNDPKPDHLKVVGTEATTIPKPEAFSLDAFKSETAATIAGVETLLTALPHHPLPQAGDFARLHPNEETYWSSELCFVSVPVKGVKRDILHLINERLAMLYLPSKKIQRFRLALATKPHDVFFLCHVPTQNQDNSWVASNLRACEQAKTRWVQALSRKEEGIEAYDIKYARDPDAFPATKWPTQSLNNLVGETFAGRAIMQDTHPALLRLVGAKPAVL